MIKHLEMVANYAHPPTAWDAVRAHWDVKRWSALKEYVHKIWIIDNPGWTYGFLGPGGISCNNGNEGTWPLLRSHVGRATHPLTLAESLLTHIGQDTIHAKPFKGRPHLDETNPAKGLSLDDRKKAVSIATQAPLITRGQYTYRRTRTAGQWLRIDDADVDMYTRLYPSPGDDAPPAVDFETLQRLSTITRFNAVECSCTRAYVASRTRTHVGAHTPR